MYTAKFSTETFLGYSSRRAVLTTHILVPGFEWVGAVLRHDWYIKISK